MNKKIVYNIGDRIGNLEFIREVHSIKNRRRAIFKCKCGNEFITVIDYVKVGDTQSCGCLHDKCSSDKWRTHGLSTTPEYELWCRIKRRCYKSNDIDYRHYGERGIKLQDNWIEDFKSFYDYIIALPNYNKIITESLTLDRIDSDENYEENNLRWANKRLQCANRRKPKSNTSGFTGVYYVKRHKNWHARVAGYHIGTYKTKEEALIARNKYIIDNNIIGYKTQKIV